jgi:hypothetical protein
MLTRQRIVLDLAAALAIMTVLLVGVSAERLAQQILEPASPRPASWLASNRARP